MRHHRSYWVVMSNFNEAKEARRILKFGLIAVVAITAIVTPGLKFWLRIIMIFSAGWIFFNMTFLLGRIQSGNKILNKQDLAKLVERNSIKHS